MFLGRPCHWLNYAHSAAAFSGPRTKGLLAAPLEDPLTESWRKERAERARRRSLVPSQGCSEPRGQLLLPLKLSSRRSSPPWGAASGAANEESPKKGSTRRLGDSSTKTDADAEEGEGGRDDAKEQEKEAHYLLLPQQQPRLAPSPELFPCSASACSSSSGCMCGRSSTGHQHRSSGFDPHQLLPFFQRLLPKINSPEKPFQVASPAQDERETVNAFVGWRPLELN